MEVIEVLARVQYPSTAWSDFWSIDNETVIGQHGRVLLSSIIAWSFFVLDQDFKIRLNGWRDFDLLVHFY